MEQSKLVQYISNLDRKDQDKFVQFVESPYFNQHRPTLLLLRLILKEIYRKKPRLTKKQVFARLFPNKTYREQPLYDVMSNLKKLLHRFLAQQQFESRPLQEELHTIQWAYEHNQFDLFTNRGKQLDKQLEKIPYRNENFFYLNYQYRQMLGYYGGEYVDRSKSEELQSMMDHLDNFYILEKLRNSCHLTAHNILMNTQYDFSILDPVLKYIEAEQSGRFADEPAIQLYYTILMTLRNDENPAYYQVLKEMLAERYDSLSPVEQQDLYSFSYNYCIRKINQGHTDYQIELFNLYKQGLRSGILLNNGIIGEWNYKNITTLGCSLKEFAWTESFINTYKDHLPAHQRENAYSYNLANLYYNKEMYDEAISALLHVQFTDIKYHLNTTYLLLRTYYAKNDIEALLSLVDTFRVYILRNKKMTTEQKKGYTNFLRFTKRLALLKQSMSTYSKEEYQQKMKKLADKIRETKNVINQKWLLRETGYAEAKEAVHSIVG